MCGIVGFINKHNQVSPEILINMRDTMIHRGPDDSGVFISNNKKVGLGHRRLSILDLSEKGRQPMSNRDGNLWITYNGEIYNFKIIRKNLEQRGHIFKSDTDTEIILHAYEEYGRQCLDLFEGMFAFAIFDEKRNSLFMARDRFGIKPLYYGFLDNNTFGFGSELKSLVAHPAFKKDINYKALGSFFTYRYIPAPLSIWQNIYKLTHGHYIILDSNNWIISDQTQYYNLIEKVASRSKSTLEEVEFLLEDAVRKRLISDVEVGTLLSGGMDSATVTYYANKLHPGIKSFAIGFNNNRDEAPHAKEIAAYIGVDHFVEYVHDVEDALFDKVTYSYDEPFADDSLFPTYILSEMTCNKVKVALSGDGGDEVFAGYRWYDRYNDQNNLINRLKKLFSTGNSFQNQYHDLLGFGMNRNDFKGIFNKDILNEVMDFEPIFKKYNNNPYKSIRNLQYIDLNSFLVDQCLVKVDRASMANSLEVRVPMIDHTFVEAVFSLPGKIFPENSTRKPLLAEIADKKIPGSVFNRPKQGFGAPLNEWENYKTNYMKTDFENYNTVKEGIINKCFYEVSNRIYYFSVFENWFNKWMR